MSTILEALQQSEAHQGPVGPEEAARNRSRRLRWAAYAGGLVVAGTVGFEIFLSRQDAGRPVSKVHDAVVEVPQPPKVAHAVRSEPKVERPRPAPVPPVQNAFARDDPPRGQVAKGIGSGQPPAAVPALPSLGTGRAQLRAKAPVPVPVVSSPTSWADAPPLRVERVGYSEAAAERTVTLRIAGADPVTLHEGESSGGVSVQLILPEMIYVSQGGTVFAVRVPP